MSTTNKLNTQPRCTFVSAAVVSDKCIIFTVYMGLGFTTIVCSLQLTYAMNRCFAAVQHYAFFKYLWLRYP